MEDHFSLWDKFESLLISSVRQGSIDALEEHLSTVEHPETYLNRVYRIDHQQQCTLLAIACLNGRIDLIHFVLKHYQIDLELHNNVCLEDTREKKQIYFGVTVLWIATSINHFMMVQLLIEHGANVNHTSQTNSTPLRSACFNGNLDMVRYLVEHGADIHIAKHNNDTNLAVAVFRQHLQVVRYLVENLACDVNVCDNDGRSPLFDAVNCGSLELIQFLLDHGARNFRANCDQMSPLMWAAEKGRLDLINAIAPYSTILEQIEAEELLASILISNDLQQQNLIQAFEHLSRALNLRIIHYLPKPIKPSQIPIFHRMSECQTIEQLQERRSHGSDWWIEALLIRERLLGPMNRKYRYSLRYQGAALLDDQEYLQGMQLLLHELELCRQHSIAILQPHIRDLISIFCEMHSIEIPISTESIQRIFKVIIEEFHTATTDIDSHLHNLVFLITLTSQYLLHENISLIHRQQLIRQIRSIDQSKFVTKTNQSSLLHLCLDANTLADEFFIDHVCQYPCLKTARLLLQCGANMNATDAIGNTPLHIFALNCGVHDPAILDFLCQHGAHLDQANIRGETAIDLAEDLIVIDWFKSRVRYSLKCLCAQVIRKNHIPFQDRITESLVTYVQKH